jgi:hypothetical protein
MTCVEGALRDDCLCKTAPPFWLVAAVVVYMLACCGWICGVFMEVDCFAASMMVRIA